MRHFDSEEYTIELLNESQELINVAGYEYEAGTLLYRADPIAFRQAELDILDGLLNDGVVIEKDDDYYWSEEYNNNN